MTRVTSTANNPEHRSRQPTCLDYEYTTCSTQEPRFAQRPGCIGMAIALCEALQRLSLTRHVVMHQLRHSVSELAIVAVRASTAMAAVARAYNASSDRGAGQDPPREWPALSIDRRYALLPDWQQLREVGSGPAKRTARLTFGVSDGPCANRPTATLAFGDILKKVSQTDERLQQPAEPGKGCTSTPAQVRYVDGSRSL
jgi:hypothetical protein